jgi:CheY-like chemotaxis protein
MTRVLLADDDAEVRLGMATALRRFGYQVNIAADGLEAAAILASDPPDVLLTDLGMPRLDGWELLTLCRSNPSFHSLPVIVMSAVGLCDLAMARGADGFLAKPFTWMAAHEAIRAAIQSYSP